MGRTLLCRFALAGAAQGVHDCNIKGCVEVTLQNTYQINTYRVLLTRARCETVIWVPEGDADDVTRSPSEFDAIARFLLECGASRLEEMAPPVASVATAPRLLL
jgi:Uncharacterized conserved protein (DUF2075)